MLHRAREALMKERTAMICRIRAFAGEYGRVFARGVAKFHEGFSAWLADPQNGLSGSAVITFRELKEQLDDKDARIAVYDKRIHQVAKEEARARQLLEVPGIGPIIATAVLATVADPLHFERGRDFAANLGLTPSEHSSGGKQRLGKITKRGDSYLRTLLIHGARSALRSRQARQVTALGHQIGRAARLQSGRSRPGQQDRARNMGAVGAWPRVCSGLVELRYQTGLSDDQCFIVLTSRSVFLE
jgi:transposase